MPKTRVKRKHNKYYPQYRSLFIWDTFTYDPVFGKYGHIVVGSIFNLDHSKFESVKQNEHGHWPRGEYGRLAFDSFEEAAAFCKEFAEWKIKSKTLVTK